MLAGTAEAQAGQTKTAQAIARPGSSASLGPLRQIDAGALNVGYIDVRPTNGPAIILLHGWPYDNHAFAEVIPLLASAAGGRSIYPPASNRSSFMAKSAGERISTAHVFRHNAGQYIS